MTIAKSQVIDIVNSFPDQVDLDEMMYCLYLKEKLELSEIDFEKNKVMSHEDLILESQSWLKK